MTAWTAKGARPSDLEVAIRGSTTHHLMRKHGMADIPIFVQW